MSETCEIKICFQMLHCTSYILRHLCKKCTLFEFFEYTFGSGIGHI